MDIVVENILEISPYFLLYGIQTKKMRRVPTGPMLKRNELKINIFNSICAQANIKRCYTNT